MVSRSFSDLSAQCHALLLLRGSFFRPICTVSCPILTVAFKKSILTVAFSVAVHIDMSSHHGDALDADDADRLGFGYLMDYDADRDQDINLDMDFKSMPDVNRDFELTDLWESKILPDYDDDGAGPRLSPGQKNLTPVGFFMLLFPLELMQYIVAMTMLYCIQQGKPLTAPFTVFELTTWMGLHVKMMMNWSLSQDDFFTDARPTTFDARRHMK